MKLNGHRPFSNTETESQGPVVPRTVASTSPGSLAGLRPQQQRAGTAASQLPPRGSGPPLPAAPQAGSRAALGTLYRLQPDAADAAVHEAKTAGWRAAGDSLALRFKHGVQSALHMNKSEQKFAALVTDILANGRMVANLPEANQQWQYVIHGTPKDFIVGVDPSGGVNSLNAGVDPLFQRGRAALNHACEHKWIRRPAMGTQDQQLRELAKVISTSRVLGDDPSSPGHILFEVQLPARQVLFSARAQHGQLDPYSIKPSGLAQGLELPAPPDPDEALAALEARTRPQSARPVSVSDEVPPPDYADDGLAELSVGHLGPDSIEPLAEQAAPAGDHIKRFVPEDRQQALAARMQAMTGQLSDGPVILGEDHTKPDARALVIDMISAGSVRELFVELGSLDLSDLGLDESEVKGHAARTASDYLREHAGEDLSGDAVWESLSEGLTWIDRHPNDIPLAKLIETALGAGVAIFFYDNDLTPNRASASAMARRNKATKQEFERSRTEGKAGTVLLVGGDHVRPERCGGPTKTIQSACGVAQDRVHDLSRT